MKYIIIYILFFFVNTIKVESGEPIKIGIISDIHYLSEQLMDDGSALQQYISWTGRTLKDTPAVLDIVLDEYLNSDIEVLLISGDMTKDGERQSHIDLVQKIKPLQDKGIKVYVIPGNHDINMPNAVAFRGSEKEKVSTVSSDEFKEIYKNCGYAQAIKSDTASLSYVVALNEHNWLIAIDAARYDEYTNISLSSGRILPQTERWVEALLDEARQKNIQVIGMLHWGLVEHIMYQSILFKEYLVDDWKRIANLFADKGMKAIFTGHFHASDITEFTSDKGNKIYDIETGTLSSYPYAYRFVELADNKMTVATRNIISTADNPNLRNVSESKMRELSRSLSQHKIKTFLPGMSEQMTDQFADILSEIFIQHAYGDEVVTAKLREAINEFSDSMNNDSFDDDGLKLDFSPADNNIEIHF